jgi:hypothetical protein
MSWVRIPLVTPKILNDRKIVEDFFFMSYMMQESYVF